MAIVSADSEFCAWITSETREQKLVKAGSVPLFSMRDSIVDIFCFDPRTITWLGANDDVPPDPSA